jgi:hypothetical protein
VSVAECGCIKEIFSMSTAWFILDALLYFISLAIYISVFIDMKGYWNLWPRNLWIHHRITQQMSSCRTACIEPQKTVHCWWGTHPWPEKSLGTHAYILRWRSYDEQGPVGCRISRSVCLRHLPVSSIEQQVLNERIYKSNTTNLLLSIRLSK